MVEYNIGHSIDKGVPSEPLLVEYNISHSIKKGVLCEPLLVEYNIGHSIVKGVPIEPLLVEYIDHSIEKECQVSHFWDSIKIDMHVHIYHTWHNAHVHIYHNWQNVVSKNNVTFLVQKHTSTFYHFVSSSLASIKPSALHVYANTKLLAIKL